jgi:hypothetical protein
MDTMQEHKENGLTGKPSSKPAGGDVVLKTDKLKADQSSVAGLC